MGDIRKGSLLVIKKNVQLLGTLQVSKSRVVSTGEHTWTRDPPQVYTGSFQAAVDDVDVLVKAMATML